MLLAVLATILQTAPADVSPMPQLAPCRFETPAVLVESLAALPPPVRAELERLFEKIGLADAGEKFNPIDVIADDTPQARFLRAYHVGGVWMVWFERGGIARIRSTLAIVESRDPRTGQTIFRTAPGGQFSGDLCVGSKAYLAGARSAA